MKHPLRTLANLALAFTAVLVTLALLELGARIAAPLPEAVRQSCNPNFGWRGIPNQHKTFSTDGYTHTVTFNSLGMHDGEHSPEKAPGVYRILLLGDSFVQAEQVNSAETSARVLEELLNRDGPAAQRFEVISGGVAAWGTGQQLMYYRDEGRHFQPDLVLLLVYMGNDISENLPFHALTVSDVTCYTAYFALCDNSFDPQPWYYAPGLNPVMGQCSPAYRGVTQLLNRLYHSSRLYSLLGPLLDRLQEHNFRRDIPVLNLYVPVENEKFRQLFPEQNRDITYGWQLAQGITTQLAQEVAADGAQFAIVLIDPADIINAMLLAPEAREAAYADTPYLRETSPAVPEHYFRQLPGPPPILNLQPHFVAHMQQTGEPLFFPYDEHWNVAGNRLAAETIYRWLRDEILPAAAQ
ncbi:MAG: hypothetical protein Kow0031_25100 [Anaerolineae bacterium]